MVLLKASFKMNGSRGGSRSEPVGANFHNLLFCLGLPAKSNGSRNGSQWEPTFTTAVSLKASREKQWEPEWKPLGACTNNLQFR